ncbi:hypothetical protein [Deinococcus sonorensis]|uniref:Uncharacterized protein n=1 Tax=Deinococcus sonorensis TaxID=309891 RepID=A0ABV8YBV7_9DEIO
MRSWRLWLLLPLLFACFILAVLAFGVVWISLPVSPEFPDKGCDLNAGFVELFILMFSGLLLVLALLTWNKLRRYIASRFSKALILGWVILVGMDLLVYYQFAQSSQAYYAQQAALKCT